MTKWRIAGLLVVLVLAALVLTLAMPVSVWRTGRLQNPPLDLVGGSLPASAPERIWVDTDAACGTSPRTDPDDCLAITWLTARGLSIAGISTVFGNADLDIVESTARNLAARLENNGHSSARVWRGAASPLAERDDGPQPAHTALRAALREGPLTILALGPLTNLSRSLQDRPDLRGKVTRVVAVMGHRPGHIFHPSEGKGEGNLLGHGPVFRDLNFTMDALAARHVLNWQVPVTLIPYDAARHVLITATDLDRLARLGPTFAWAADNARGWLDHWRQNIGQQGFFPFDWIAAASLVEPALFRCASTTARIEKEWSLWVYPRDSLVVGPSASGEGAVPVTYCPEVDPQLRDLLLTGTDQGAADVHE